MTTMSQKIINHQRHLVETESEMPEYEKREILEAYLRQVPHLVKPGDPELFLSARLDNILKSTDSTSTSQQAQVLANDWVTAIKQATNQTYCDIFSHLDGQYRTFTSLDHPDNDTLNVLLRLLSALFVFKAEARRIDNDEIDFFAETYGLWNTVLLLKDVCDDLIADPDTVAG